MIELIIGIIFVVICGYAETECSKNERATSFSFITLLALICIIRYSDLSYILYPLGIMISFIGWSILKEKRKQLQMEVMKGK